MSNGPSSHNTRKFEVVSVHCQLLTTAPPEELAALDTTMCRGSVISAEGNNPNFGAVYRAEAAKFSALAERLSPPHVVADYIKAFAEQGDIALPISADQIHGDLEAVVKTFQCDDVNIRFGQKRWPAGSVASFLCTDPLRTTHILTACTYLSYTLQAFMEDITTTLAESDLAVLFRNFGKQYASGNLTEKVPLALHHSLLSIKGIDAEATEIDDQVCRAALKLLRDLGRFGSSWPSEGGDIEIRCPMEGYLYKLLVTHRALSPLLQAQDRLFRLVRGGGPLQEKDPVHLSAAVHLDNVVLIVPKLLDEARKLVHSAPSRPSGNGSTVVDNGSDPQSQRTSRIS